jgi:hypothetical protein
MSSARSGPSALTISEEGDARFAEGPSGRQLIRTAEDVGLVVESCFSARVNCALLYAPNLPERFFDLSSGEAGVILQKLRNYRIRVAVVCTPDRTPFSDRFREMADEEKRSNHFRVFESREAAQEWLSHT